MNNDWETFQTAYQSASADVKTLIASEEIKLFVDITLPFVEDKLRIALVRDITDWLLAMSDATQVKMYTEAGILTAAEGEKISNWVLEKLGTNKNNPTLLPTVSNIRTMKSDAEEPVYTSTQSAILNEGREASSNQTVSQGDTKPRWDSER